LEAIRREGQFNLGRSSTAAYQQRRLMLICWSVV